MPGYLVAVVDEVDIAVIGAGAAGLMAAIWAGQSARKSSVPARVIALDGARTLGAKILVAGGGRCNVTHFFVDETAYAGSSRNAIKKVLRSFDAQRTIEFFADLGVELKREETGKLFPVTDSARTVLDALLRASRDVGVEIRHPWRVDRVERAEPDGFVVVPVDPALSTLRARAVILATGGKALPKSGSDGHGYEIVESLGHTVTPWVFPSLVPLVVDVHKTFIQELSGIAVEAELTLESATGKRIVAFRNAMLFTHFGISGPAALDISRYVLDARRTDPGATLVANLVPGRRFEQVDAMLGAVGAEARQSVVRRIVEQTALPERLVRTLCEHVGVDAATALHQLPRAARRTLAHALTELPIPVVGDRGFTHAEVTAGGVPLSEVHLGTMESRIMPGLFLCGELCDVDGRIGGFNFQWAWASGYLAGCAAGRSFAQATRE